ncbi:MAG: LytR C-terminal domain-containing protein [candidate division WOR-3 bacterium]
MKVDKTFLLRGLWVVIAALTLLFFIISVIPKNKKEKPYTSITDEKLDVVVLNGTKMDKLAYTVSQYLKGKGVDVIYYGNADSIYSHTLIIDRRDSINLSYAKRVARFIKGKIMYMPDPDNIAPVFVILGNDYK